MEVVKINNSHRNGFSLALHYTKGQQKNAAAKAATLMEIPL